MKSAKQIAPVRRAGALRPEGPALDRTRLVQVLLDIARRQGMEALNIRPVAQALGVAPRLIYHHVSGKEEMLALLTDEILRGRMPGLSPGDWESRLRNVAEAVQLAYRDYPGSASFILSRSANRLEQPNPLRIRDAIFDALAQAGSIRIDGRNSSSSSRWSCSAMSWSRKACRGRNGISPWRAARSRPRSRAALTC